HHRMTNHNAAAVEALCGRTPLKGDLEFLAGDPTDFPCYGSAVSYLTPGARPVPPYLALPHITWNAGKLAGRNAGFLGAAYGPLHVPRDPTDPAFRVGEMALPDDVTLRELEHRQSIRQLLDRQARGWEEQAGTGAMDAFYEKAFRLLRSPEASRAFDISQEDPRTRDRYGRNKHGQSLLLARRLVEAGGRFVSGYDGSRNGIGQTETPGKKFQGPQETHTAPGRPG